MKKNQTQKVGACLLETYVAIIKNSVGSRMFRNSYATLNGKKQDILKNGAQSCAFFVSSILIVTSSLTPDKNRLLQHLHATVSGTITDMKKSGWEEIRTPKVGSVLIWETQNKKTGPHSHIGFYIGGEEAISNNSIAGGKIIRHHFTYGTKGKPTRKIVQILHHPLLK